MKIKLPEPDHVNQTTHQSCRDILHEKPIKAIFRSIYNVYLSWRYGILLGEGFRWGYHLNIRRGVVAIGHFAFVGSYSWLIYPTVIGDLTMLAPHVKIVGKDHEMRGVGVPTRIAPPEKHWSQIITTFESDAWIGQGAMIYHGLTIGRGAVIAAGSVVTKDVPRYAVMAGVPAKLIRMRFSPSQIESHKKILYD